ncbi:MAG TPA: alpha/beta hydrolase, partial [Bacteroidia bacterium]
YASSGLSKMIPSNLYNKIYPFTDWSFGLKTPAEKQLLRQIISSSSPEFLKWAIHEIVCWKNTERPKTIFHVHGSMDRIFPIEYVRPDAVIPGGGHFMIFSHADVISKMLKDKLKE